MPILWRFFDVQSASGDASYNFNGPSFQSRREAVTHRVLGTAARLDEMQ
jgi:hypothetical protein